MAFSGEQTMRDFVLALQITLYEKRYLLVASALVVAAWLIFSAVIPSKYVDLIVYAVFGWCFLGSVVIPWIEAKLEKLFS